MIYDEHDYANDMPDYRSVGGSRLYVEQDLGASSCDDQLPVLSTIGRGPRGNGIYVVKKADKDGEFVFELVDDVTNETIITSPNIAAPKISVEDVTGSEIAGQATDIRFRIEHGSEVTDKTIRIPGGQDGANIFIHSKEIEVTIDSIYQGMAVFDLKPTRTGGHRSLPEPRLNDLVIAISLEGFSFGIIVNKDNNTVDVLFRAFCDFPVPTIGENGNWFIYGKDTGHKAQGDSITLAVGSVTEGDDPKAYLTSKNGIDYILDLVLARGPKGETLHVKSGVWTADAIPAYDDAEEGDAYIVKVSDDQYDLYVAGARPSSEPKGWTIIENWGRLNSTDSFDILPIKRGGTGADNVVDANANLINLSLQDATAGNIGQGLHTYHADTGAMIVTKDNSGNLIALKMSLDGYYQRMFITDGALNNAKQTEILTENSCGLLGSIASNEGVSASYKDGCIYTPIPADSSTPGVIAPGIGLEMNKQYLNLKKATGDSLGGVLVGSTETQDAQSYRIVGVDKSGYLVVKPATASSLGVVSVPSSSGLLVNDGHLSVRPGNGIGIDNQGRLECTVDPGDAAQIAVGPSEPTDANIVLWIKTE